AFAAHLSAPTVAPLKLKWGPLKGLGRFSMRMKLRFALRVLSSGCFGGAPSADPPKGPAPAGTIAAAPIVTMPSGSCCDAGHDAGCGGAGDSRRELLRRGVL